MANILIATQVADLHGLAVATVLERRGHRCIRWFGADFPSRKTSTFSLSSGDGFRWTALGPELEVDAPIDVVWLRRAERPQVPVDQLHPEDVWLAEREIMHFFESIWFTLGEQARWVNPHHGAQRARSKVLQLKLALEAGFDVPSTIVSNDPREIRTFLQCHAARGTIFKPSVPAAWRVGDRKAILATSRVTGDRLPSDSTLRLTPGIFQELIPKAYELRVTCMGSHCVVLRIDSQRDPRAHMDWRSAPAKDLSTALCELPAEVQAGCSRLMERLGIVFGCFDFIVTPDGRTVFLEVNEAGQFLFVEELHPEARLLDAFCEFLASPSTDFKPTFADERVGFADLWAEPAFQERWRRDGDVHLTDLPPWVSLESLYGKAE